MEPISFIKATQEFFSTNPHGRKIEIPEFKALTESDKNDIRNMLIAEGINVAPLVVKAA